MREKGISKTPWDASTQRSEAGRTSFFADMVGEEYSLYDLVPHTVISTLLEAHQRVIQVPVGLVSPDNELLLSLGDEPICTEFHHFHPAAQAGCLRTNPEFRWPIQESGKDISKCENGLWDIAMPILVGNRHLATVFIGQFLFEDDDEAYFREQAARHGFDEAAYLQALSKVRRLSRERVNELIDYTATLVQLLADLGLKNLQLTREIKERQIAEFALSEGERRYRALVENVPGAVYLCLNDDAYTTVFMSDAIEIITGIPAQTMINTAAPIMDLIHPEDRPAVVRFVNEAIAKKEPYMLSYRMLRKDGDYIWVEERGQAVREEGGELAFLQGVIFDVSERHRFEEERRNIEAQMARAHNLESLGILAGGIAHDFNNLLVGILGHAELIRDDVPPGSYTAESVDAIIAAAHSAAELTHKMLAYSGKGRLNTESADMSAIVRCVQPLLQTKAAGAYTIHYELHDSLPPVAVDIGQVNQIIISLVDNAIEAYAQGTGDIFVRTGLTRFDHDFAESTYLGLNVPRGEYVFLEVADNGSGMCLETRRRLCDPFFTTKFTGRGLSMAAVLGITRCHDAHLSVESEPGLGSSVRIFFPTLMSKSGGASPRGTGEGVSRDVPHDAAILIVDDEPIVLNAAGKMLTRAGFRVLTADSGHKALQAVRDPENSIVCVILDLTMPDMNGEETLREMRELRPGIPVILSSGYNRETAIARLASLDVATFLQKPYDSHTLYDVLNGVMRQP